MIQGWGKIPEEIRAKEICVSASKIIKFLESPRHYHYEYVLNKREEPTPAMKRGTMIHKAILEPETFYTEYANPILVGQLRLVKELQNELMMLDLNPKGKKDELIDRLLAYDYDQYSDRIVEAYEEKLLKQNKKLLSLKDVETITEISKSIMDDPIIVNLLSKGEKEKLGYFQDKETGIVISFKIDYLCANIGNNIPFCLDLKTVVSAKPDKIGSYIYNYNIHVQLAIYCDAIKALLGYESKTGILACESSAPFCAQVYSLDFGALSAGASVYKRALMGFKECYLSNVWPAYGGGVKSTTIPKWAFDQIEYSAELDSE